jgi:hypothetical protein
MRHSEKGLCPKEQIHGTNEIIEILDALKYHYFTFLISTQQRLFWDGNAR